MVYHEIESMEQTLSKLPVLLHDTKSFDRAALERVSPQRLGREACISMKAQAAPWISAWHVLEASSWRDSADAAGPTPEDGASSGSSSVLQRHLPEPSSTHRFGSGRLSSS